MMLNEMLGIKYPFIQGAMAHIATGQFAADVSNAGALGIIASGGFSAERVREEIKICKAATDKPFGVNLMLMNPDIDAIADVVAEEKVAMVTTGGGNPAKYIQNFKAAGVKVFPVHSSTVFAKKYEADGVDAIIAEGMESGGHIGNMTTMPLIPQMVDALSIPVIAAGGIADGRGVAAALALGAIGVQVGTCLLVAEECPVHENYKKEILKAKDNSTAITGAACNNPVRVIKNGLARKFLKLEKEMAGPEEFEKIGIGALRRAVVEGDMVNGSVMCGQVVGLANEIKPLKVIFEEMYQQSKQVIDALKALNY